MICIKKFATRVSYICWMAGVLVTPLLAGERDNYPARLTLPYTLKKARQSSTRFQFNEADLTGIQSSWYQSQAPYAARLSLGVRKLNDRFEPSNPFAPNQTLATTYFVGVQKGIPWTGTQLGIEFQHSNTNLGFQTLNIAPYYESRLVLTARQSLLQSLVWGLDRKRSEAGRQGSEAADFSYQGGLDQTTLGLIQIYYQAWLGQADVRAATSNYNNKKELLKITEIKARRGTAERPDVLQAESALLSAEIQRVEAIRALGNIWRLLIVSLKLPEALLSVDPMIIPVDLDAPIFLAREQCGKSNKPDSLAKKQTMALATAAELNAQSLKAQNNMDLVLSGTYGANGIDQNSRARTWSETRDRNYPAWSLEVAAQIPLGASAVRGEAISASANAIRARAQYDQAQDEEKVQWINRCLELDQKEENFKRNQEISKFQKERLKLEEQRFKIGRSSLTQVVIASDDSVLAERSLQQQEVERRLAAWRVHELKGGLYQLGTSEASGAQL
jgi:outer membrane protein TolC